MALGTGDIEEPLKMLLYEVLLSLVNVDYLFEVR